MPKAQYKIKTDCFVVVKTSWKETNDMFNCILHYILLYFYCLFVSLLLFLFFLVMITANLYFNFISTFPVTTSFHIFQQCVLVLNYIILNAKCKLLFFVDFDRWSIPDDTIQIHWDLQPSLHEYSIFFSACPIVGRL